MAKKAQQGAGSRPAGKRPNVVNSAKRGGPPKTFWYALGAVAVIGIGALSWQATQGGAKATAIDPTLPPLKAEGYVMGSPTAPIEIMEFADFECPGCGQFTTLTEPDVRARLINTGKVRMRFMDFPLPMHKNTNSAHLAAACANEQGKFWEMHDLIFQNQDRWNGEATSKPRGPLGDLAKSLQLDMTKYNACMDAETYRRNIMANQAEGERRQVQQTPTFIIGAQKIPGALPFDALNKMVEDAIKALPATPAAAPADTTPEEPVNKRMLAALVALAGLFVALYLTLYKLGYIGTLACAVGSCEKVQTSKWATFLGFPVGAWGVAYYLAVLGVALAGVSPALIERKGVSQLLVAMTGVGLVFSLWLTYLELFVIDAICMWCVISAVLATMLFVLCWLDLREQDVYANELAEEAAGALRGSGYGLGIRNTSEVSIRAIGPEE